ncbi:hypothetical protein ScPMuIL_015907 [Solemya velum]
MASQLRQVGQILTQRVRLSCTTVITRCVSDDTSEQPLKEKKTKPHPETPGPGEYEVDPPKGKIFDKKPFKMELEAGKKYAWCTCGRSHRQPFCDGTHKIHWQDPKHRLVKFHPHRFTVDESKDYWLCNCKQTEKRPFCDGTHKRADIQKSIRS